MTSRPPPKIAHVFFDVLHLRVGQLKAPARYRAPGDRKPESSRERASGAPAPLRSPRNPAPAAPGRAPAGFPLRRTATSTRGGPFHARPRLGADCFPPRCHPATRPEARRDAWPRSVKLSRKATALLPAFNRISRSACNCAVTQQTQPRRRLAQALDRPRGFRNLRRCPLGRGTVRSLK